MTPKRFALIKAVLDRRQSDLTVLADGVHKTHNIAAIIRSCDATGVLELHAVSPQGEIPRHHATNAGTSRWTRLNTHENMERAIDHLRGQGFQLLAAHASESAIDFRSADYTRPTAILVGTELDGLSDIALQAADQHIAIPMLGMVESLNVSVATALILYEAQKQRQTQGLYAQSRLDPATYAHILFEWAYPDIARRCREKGCSYPSLSDDGEMLTNPFAN